MKRGIKVPLWIGMWTQEFLGSHSWNCQELWVLKRAEKSSSQTILVWFSGCSEVYYLHFLLLVNTFVNIL